MMKEMSPILARDIEKLRNDEVRQIIFRFCEWLHDNVKMPCIDIVDSDVLLTLMMRLSYSGFWRKLMTKFRKSIYVQATIQRTVNNIRHNLRH